MKILIGCDVDPVVPTFLSQPGQVAWEYLDELDRLLRTAGGLLPPITWLIRADEIVRFSAGSWDHIYVKKYALWQSLLGRGHQLGWHVHTASFDSGRKCFGFDPDPAWLSDAHHALAAHFDIRATRTGWDYASNVLFARLEALNIAVDFSALPGYLAWHKVGYDRLQADWVRCPDTPYHPSRNDYQLRGDMKIIEIPITQFPNSLAGMAKRSAWRLWNGSLCMRGLQGKTKMLTDRWDALPPAGPVAAFYFHPRNLLGDGIANMMRNIELLQTVPGAEFITASAAGGVFGQ